MASYNNSDACNPYTDDIETHDHHCHGQPYDVFSFLEHINSLEKSATIFIMVFTILGNTLVLVATWGEKSLHQPNKYFVASLAVADLMVGLFVAPLWLHQIGKESCDDAIIETPIHLCRFIIWIDTITLTASIYTLSFISFDRYLKITKPFQYKSRMTTSASMKVIFIIWLISAAFATYSASPKSGSSGLFMTATCASIETTKEFYTFLAVAAFFLPTAVILVMYSLIFCVAHKRQNMLRNGELGQNLNNSNQQKSALRKDMKLIRTLLVVVGVFIICWGPYFIWSLLEFFEPNLFEGDENSISFQYSTEIPRFVAMTLPQFNSLCNPIIYACLDQTYGKAFKHLLQQLTCRPRSKKSPPSSPIELHRLRQT